ncbi:MAG: ATP-binding protein [Pseudomonadota bacterium]
MSSPLPPPDSDTAAARIGNEAFLLEVRQALHDEIDCEVILSETSARLGRHLGASRVGYGELSTDAAWFLPRSHWIDGSVVEISEPVRFEVFGPAITGSHHRGEVWVHTSLEDPRLDDEGRATCAPLGICAAVTVPLVKAGRLVSLISVQQASPRDWTDAEIDLVREVAERTWATLEWARAETARREGQILFDTILAHAPIGIYVKDADGRFVIANDEMGRLQGRPASELIGRRARDLSPPRQAGETGEADARALAHGGLTVSERHDPEADTYRDTLAMRFPVPGHANGPPWLAGFEIDVTGQKEAERALERSREALFQSEKLAALGALLSGVSHELNNPLSIIAAQAELLEHQATGSVFADRAGKIRRAAERAARIVQTFLAMSRHAEPRRRPVAINAVVTSALDQLEPMLGDSAVRVTRRLAADLPSIVADADQLHQVLVNLVVNAEQAMQAQAGDRAVIVESRPSPDGRAIWVDVRDTGPGVPEAIRRRIFEPFFTTKPQDVGSGVGLAVSQGIVEAHGGALERLDSEAGAHFRMTLPVGPPA